MPIGTCLALATILQFANWPNRVTQSTFVNHQTVAKSVDQSFGNFTPPDIPRAQRIFHTKLIIGNA